MTAIFFSKHYSNITNSIANVVFNHSCYLFSERTNYKFCVLYQFRYSYNIGTRTCYRLTVNDEELAMMRHNLCTVKK